MNNDEARANGFRFVGGLLTALAGMLLLRGLLSLLTQGALAHALVLLVAGWLLWLLVRLWREGSSAAFGWGVATALLLSNVAAAWSAGAIARYASETAAGRSYCLYVSDGRTGYRVARHILDLSPIRMWANGHGFQFHAVIATQSGEQPNLYNWSYRQWEFLPFDNMRNTAARQLPPCTSKPDFADNLPLL